MKPKPKVVLKKMTPPTNNVSHQQSQSTTHMYSNVPISSSAITAYSYNNNNSNFNIVNDNYTNNIFSNNNNSNYNHNAYNNGDVDNKDGIGNVTNQQQSQFITQMYSRESNKDDNDEGKVAVNVSHQQSQSVSQINSSAPNNNNDDDDDDDDEFDDGKDHDRW